MAASEQEKILLNNLKSLINESDTAPLFGKMWTPKGSSKVF
jgi:hypothetical protein